MFGGQGLPNFLPFLKKALSVDINHELEKQPHENHVVAPQTSTMLSLRSLVLLTFQEDLLKRMREFCTHTVTPSRKYTFSDTVVLNATSTWLFTPLRQSTVRTLSLLQTSITCASFPTAVDQMSRTVCCFLWRRSA